MSARSMRRARSRQLDRASSRSARVGRRLGATAAISIGGSALLAQAAEAADITVSSNADAGADSLREAIDLANADPADDRILFNSSLSGDTITLTTGELGVDTDQGKLEIDGSGADGLEVSGGGTQGILIAGGVGDFAVSDLSFIDGTSDTATGGVGAGGAIFSYIEGQFSVRNSSFSGNVAVDNFGGAVAAFQKYPSSTVSIADSTFSANEAPLGGAVFSTSLDGQISKSAFDQNTAAKYGGALLTFGRTDFDRLTISRNTAGSAGGGLTAFSYYSDSITDTTITGNEVTGQDGGASPAVGGGATILAAPGPGGAGVEIANSTISGNEATAEAPYSAQGGGLALIGAASISNTEVSGNRALGPEAGAGGMLAGGKYGGYGVEIRTSTIANNHSDAGGGGLETYNAVDVKRSTISGNTGAVGGLRAFDYEYGEPLDPANALQLTNSTVSGNTAVGSSTTPSYRSGYGGGVYLNGEVGGTIKNSTIAGNTAQLGGGGIFSYAGADYSGGGGGYAYTYYTTQDRTLSSTIVGDNKAAGLPNDLGTDDSGASGVGFAAGFSLIETPGSAVLDSNPAGSNLLGSDPELGPLADNGGPTRTLEPNGQSPVVDQGTANGLLVDQRGEPRTTDRPPPAAGDGTDIGSVELPGDLVPPLTTITSGPAQGSTVLTSSVSFGFDADEEATFECQLDGGGFKPCSSPKTYDDLSNDSHTFQVRAIDSAGNAGPIAERTFKAVLGFCNGTPATIVAEPGVPTTGTSGPDVIVGTDGPDEIEGLGGNDQICAQGGDDVVRAGGGDDAVTGDNGADDLEGGAGADRLFGAVGDDLVDGGSGGDMLDGGEGDDRLFGRGGIDTVDGRGGADEIRGNGGGDTTGGGPGGDLVRGDTGDDEIRGGKGKDDLRGAAGDDEIRGAKKNDRLRGGAGDDALNGGKGRNDCNGGSGVNVLRNCN